MRKRHLVAGVAGLLILGIALFAFIVSRERLRRHRVFRVAPAEERANAPVTIPPPAEWTQTFDTLAPRDLALLLTQIEAKHPDLYARWSLGYLHARMLIEINQYGIAAKKLQPFLEDSRFADLAIYHLSEVADDAGASVARQKLISDYPKSVYRDQALEEEADYLGTLEDPSALTAFVGKVTPSTETRTRRDLNARIVEVLIRRGDTAGAFASGLTLLGAETGDDAADRIARALDQPQLIERMTPQQRAMLGETFRGHRHFDRAVALLSSAISALPARRDELQFSIGRSFFGNEKFDEAQQAYMSGANGTKDARWKATFLFHASRAAQLQGDDAGAERLMTASIAVPGTFPATTAALTQRIRTRIKQKRFAEAASDLQLLRKLAEKDHAVVDGSIAYALGMLAEGNRGVALATLDAVPKNLLDKYDVPEIAYWRARALEESNPKAAFAAYLSVLRSSVPTHFAYFARERLDSPAMAPKLAQELSMREAQATNLAAARQFALAKDVETDRILLSSKSRPAEIARLASIYRQLPQYAAILDLQPDPLPRFPLEEDTGRAGLLMAMGLYDEAVDDITRQYPLRPLRSALTQAVALNRGNASRESIYAVEVLMKSAPADFVPDLLPQTVRQLLYPRYFLPFIVEDSKEYGADPTLVLSIMREESRFNPRAKSQAAARGLLQFIITTARDIGRNIGLVDVAPEDLYDPRVIISLGAKYVSELSGQLGGNRYRTAAAYNAGPKQVALWSRLAPAEGDDWFLSSINFEETKHYVRKVMNSYKRYGEIYGTTGPTGGMRIEP